MAKSNLDQILRALVGVDRNYLGTVADIANRLNSADASRWHDRFSGVLQEGLPPIEPPPPLLVFDDEHVATVDLSQPHNPVAFWSDTDEAPARRVWGTVTSTVVAKAESSGPSGIVKVRYAEPSRGTTVREILVAPGVDDNDPSRACHIIASMIAKQPNGEYSKDGLLNGGKANLFPCGSLLVHVSWDGVYRRWGVDGWYPDYDVDAGRRVFSGNLIR